MKPLNTNNITVSPIDRIKPNPRNAREHPEDQVAQIARSIQEFGFTQPILVDETGMVLAGHGRLLAAQQFELTEAPVLVIAGLTETEVVLEKNIFNGCRLCPPTHFKGNSRDLVPRALTLTTDP